MTAPHPSTLATLTTWRGGVSDLSDAIDEITDTGILSKKIVSESDTNAYIKTGIINTYNSASFTASSYGIIFACCGSAQFAAYFWRDGFATTLFQTGSQIGREIDGCTLTVTMNGSYAGIRYIAIIN